MVNYRSRAYRVVYSDQNNKIQAAYYSFLVLYSAIKSIYFGQMVIYHVFVGITSTALFAIMLYILTKENATKMQDGFQQLCWELLLYGQICSRFI